MSETTTNQDVRYLAVLMGIPALVLITLILAVTYYNSTPRRSVSCPKIGCGHVFSVPVEEEGETHAPR